jgi:hypothetical protein
VYYAFCDIVLLSQCLYYRGYCFGRKRQSSNTPEPDETSSLLPSAGNGDTIDPTHYSPATPLIDPPTANSISPMPSLGRASAVQTVILNVFVVFLVIAAGIFGYILSVTSNADQKPRHPATPEQPEFNTVGQIFGYGCALLYLSSRMPQILLNHRRRSTDGIALLFFLFACIGNVTYVISIIAYAPPRTCEPGELPGKHQHFCLPASQDSTDWYWRYIAVNASWLVGSVGTLVQDFIIFAQFFAYGDGLPKLASGSAPLFVTE